MAKETIFRHTCDNCDKVQEETETGIIKMKKFRIVKRRIKNFFGTFDRYEIHELKYYTGFLGPFWMDAEFACGKTYKSFEAADAALAAYLQPEPPDFEVIKEYEV